MNQKHLKKQLGDWKPDKLRIQECIPHIDSYLLRATTREFQKKGTWHMGKIIHEANRLKPECIRRYHPLSNQTQWKMHALSLMQIIAEERGFQQFSIGMFVSGA